LPFSEKKRKGKEKREKKKVRTTLWLGISGSWLKPKLIKAFLKLSTNEIEKNSSPVSEIIFTLTWYGCNL